MRIVVLLGLLALAAPAPARAVTVRQLGHGFHVSITRDGGVVAFQSNKDVVPADEDGKPETADEGGGTFLMPAAGGGATRIFNVWTYNDETTLVNAAGPLISADGSRLVVSADGTFANEPSAGYGLYLRPVGGGASPLHRHVGSPPRLAISATGGAVAFDQYDQASRTYTLYYSTGGLARPIAAGGLDPALSADGRYLAYVLEKPAGTFAVMVRDTRTGKDKRASADAKGRPKSGFGPSISGDGRYVAFRSVDEVVEGAERWAHVYVKDMVKGRVRIASVTAKGRIPKGSGILAQDPFGTFSGGTSISADGKRVAFISNARLTRDDASATSDDLFVKNLSTGAVERIPLNGRRVPDNDFQLAAGGHHLVFSSYLSGAASEQAMSVALLAGAPAQCQPAVAHPDQGLDAGEREDLRDALRPTAREVTAARNALAADSAAHPENKAADHARLAELSAMVRRYRPRASTSDSAEKFVDDARCKLLEDARAKAAEYLESKGHKDKVELAERFSRLRDALSGEIADGDKEKLLNESIEDLFEQIGGKGAAKKYSGPVSRVYKLLKAELEGKLDAEAKKQLKDSLTKQFKEASKKYFGRDAPELVDKLLTLRDVLAGDPSDAKRQKVLEEAVSGLATRVLGKGFLELPQIRALMFGFELGRSFGERIAKDLELIANQQLANDCAVALKPTQSNPGVIDYSKAATATVPKPLWHAGWRCDVLPEAFVQGAGGGMVQATRPDDASTKDKILWRITTTGTVVTFDPSYAR